MKKKNQNKADKKEKRKNFRKSLKRWVVDILFIALGAFSYSLAINMFTAPNDIAPGGIGGLATVINHVIGGTIGIGVLFALINIPLVIAGFIKLGRMLMVRTLIAVVFVSIGTDVLKPYFPVYEGDRILAALFGGLLIGTGLGLVYYREGTTGGTDIINKLIQKAKPHLSLGAITMATDAVIVLISILVYGNIESGLYAVVAIFVGSKVIDAILYGTLQGKLVLIFSSEPEKIGSAIINDLARGATMLNGTGVYSGNNKNVICCAVHKNEYVKLKRKVREIDPSAFIVTAVASEILGEGFHSND